MLLATGLDVIGHGTATIGALPAQEAASQRLLCRMLAASFLLALAGIGLAFPIL